MFRYLFGGWSPVRKGLPKMKAISSLLDTDVRKLQKVIVGG
jgi:hypothetical protein